MDESGTILFQISFLKDTLDKVNEEIEANIKRTREVESEIVKCSEIEEGLLKKEAELTKIICVMEFDMSGLIPVSVVARTSLELLDKELSCLQRNLADTLDRINKNREKFLGLCGNFQRDLVNGEREDLQTLLTEKVVLENEIFNLKAKTNALKGSTSAFMEEILVELRNSNSVLQDEVHHRNLENEKLLEGIDELKNSLVFISTLKDHPW